MNERLSCLGNRIWSPAISSVHEPMAINHLQAAGTAGLSAGVRLDIEGGSGSQSTEQEA